MFPLKPPEAITPARASDRPGVAALGRAARTSLVLALVCIGFSLNPRFAHTFWTAQYLPTILQQAATNIILAVGMTFVILTAGIDLSVGSVMALCGVGLGMSVKTGPPLFLACAMALPLGIAAGAAAQRATGRASAASAAAAVLTVVAGFAIERGMAGGIRLEWAIMGALGIGTACGLLNGLASTVGRVPPFIATLGMLTAARGLTVFATNGNSVSGLPDRLGWLGQGAPLVGIAFAVVVLGALLLNRTAAGRYIRAIGGNEEACRLTGVNVSLYKTLAYAISGLCAAVAAVALTAKFQVADTGSGVNAELNAIAAVVIGGTSLSGGRGSVIGSLVGALTIAVLNSGLVLVGVPDTLQGVVVGAVIVVTVMVDQFSRGRAADMAR